MADGTKEFPMLLGVKAFELGVNVVLVGLNSKAVAFIAGASLDRGLNGMPLLGKQR